MILIAPDKYRGTLTANQAASVISRNIKGSAFILPMADGGEGTAECIASMRNGWEKHGEGIFVNPTISMGVIDSASMVGMNSKEAQLPPLERSTEILAMCLYDMIYGALLFDPLDIVLVGIGGTCTCDGGKGLIEYLGVDPEWSNHLIGLADVAVPLLPKSKRGLSALSFCAQKGFTPKETEVARENLETLQLTYGPARSRFAGAGGGIGYALADVLGCKVTSGAGFIIKMASIPWDKITCVITGEGCYDSRTNAGKVVESLRRSAHRRGIPTICLAGSVTEDARPRDGLTVINLSTYYPDLPLTKTTARRRLAAAARDLSL